MSAIVELVNASGLRVPPKRLFTEWTTATLKRAGRRGQSTVSLRIVDEQEGMALNSHYRAKGYATNVLSFPVPPALQAGGQLGDIALCAAVVKQEAQTQNKKLGDHWAHLVVHGVLHLLGYDHERRNDAKAMEALEVRILAGLGIKDPYQP